MEVLKILPDMFVQFEFYVDSGSGKYEMEIANRTINICRLFREPRYEPILQILYKLVIQHGNFPKRCPIQKVKLVFYSATNFLLFFYHSKSTT